MMREKLSLPAFDYKIRQHDDGEKIWDPVRKKYVALTPEEWVRQHIVHFLLGHKNIPIGLTAIEKQFRYNNMTQRADVVVFDSTARPRLIVECKAPSVNVTQQTFEQIARYNVPMRVDYLMVSNGISHYYCKMDYVHWSYKFLNDLPEYESW
ncbi:MAG: type I restriction enzyme HsdR N-terminal domain-containing protein [Bacteroidales bacterium]